MIPPDDGCLYGCASLIGRAWRWLGLGLLLLALLAAGLAQGQGDLAACVWARLGHFDHAWSWHSGSTRYVPMDEAGVNALLARADLSQPAVPDYGLPGFEDDVWVLPGGRRVSTRTSDYTWAVFVNDAALVAVYQDRVIVVGFRDDGNPDAAWHCVCGAFGMSE